MAKSKRKIYSTQRDKSVIEAAKQLKKAGILSPKANLHSGRYVSRSILAKVREYQQAAAKDYRAVKVSRAMAKEAKERGFQVVRGNYIVGPNEPTFRKRLSEGTLTGIRPVKGGMLEEVILPHGVMDMRSLVHQLEGGIDDLKAPGEQFAFKFFGNESYRAFRNTEDLLDYLRHYKSIFDPNGSLKAEDLQEEFANFVLFRLHPSDSRELLYKPRVARAKQKRSSRTQQHRRGKQSVAEKLANMDENRANRIRTKWAKKAADRREKMTPQAKEEYKEKARARAQASYQNRKK